MTQSGSIAGLIDGGAGGFDCLIVDGQAGGTTIYTPTGPHSGSLALGSRSIAFAGLEPITLTGPQADVVVDGSDGDDQMVVSDLGGGMLEISGATFESVTFPTPTRSLTVDGAGGTDQIRTSNVVNLGAASLFATAESISIPAATGLLGTGDITLQATGRSSVSASASPAPVNVQAQVWSSTGRSGPPAPCSSTPRSRTA